MSPPVHSERSADWSWVTNTLPIHASWMTCPPCAEWEVRRLELGDWHSTNTCQLDDMSPPVQSERSADWSWVTNTVPIHTSWMTCPPVYTERSADWSWVTNTLPIHASWMTCPLLCTVRGQQTGAGWLTLYQYMPAGWHVPSCAQWEVGRLELGN